MKAACMWRPYPKEQISHIRKSLLCEHKCFKTVSYDPPGSQASSATRRSYFLGYMYYAQGGLLKSKTPHEEKLFKRKRGNTQFSACYAFSRADMHCLCKNWCWWRCIRVVRLYATKAALTGAVSQGAKAAVPVLWRVACRWSLRQASDLRHPK